MSGGSGCGRATVNPAPYRPSRRSSTVLPGPPYRHSRVSGNLDGTEKTSPLPPNRRRIPDYAGMTVGDASTVLIRPKILSILSIHVN